MLEEKQRLEALKTIAETLNESVDREGMIQDVLDQLIAITHFESGWVFLESGNVQLVADTSLPEALAMHEKAAMCGEDCYCVSKYKKGKLTRATNIMNCKRIEKAIVKGEGDTNGITHHATVPLKTPTQSFGLLNVAAPYRDNYDQAELDLLESVAYQMGTALKRMELYEVEQQRVHMLRHLHTLSKEIQEAHSFSDISQVSMRNLKKLSSILRVTLRLAGNTYGDQVSDSSAMSTYTLSEEGDQLILFIREDISDMEEEMLHLAVEYITLGIRERKLKEREKELARFEERAKLAQDLHDSVNQLLFSVLLTAKGTRAISMEEKVQEQLHHIQTLTSDALQEMRNLIQRLKPQGMEEGVLAGLTRYAEKIGLAVKTASNGTTSLPYRVEEVLWRIGQEALHNASKYAACQQVTLTLTKGIEEAVLEIDDDGRGFDHAMSESLPSYGLKGMRERAELAGGRCMIESTLGKGTTVTVTIPTQKEGGLA
ncbi:GAF domain-containing sensor histidine kinase [Pontibacillus salicampi]|uniref:histidine kinase n=1 Tax=Pontibacillus salicampi TaxID=1449801 RepID=A0ABV6LLV6_9BACI